MGEAAIRRAAQATGTVVIRTPNYIRVMAYVVILALLFTVGSFWWLQARRGSLTAARPFAYAFTREVRLRLPLVLYNDGAVPLLVADLRVVIADVSRGLNWITTRTFLRPEAEEGFAFATPFAVAGRGTREVIAEFGDEDGWTPEPSTSYRLQVQAQIHPSDNWVVVADFDWWSPPASANLNQDIAYPNGPR